MLYTEKICIALLCSVFTDPVTYALALPFDLRCESGTYKCIQLISFIAFTLKQS